MSIKSKLWALLTVSVGIMVIFYAYNRVPADLTRDEVDFAKLAISLNSSSYTPYSPMATGHSTLYFYIILALFKILGISSFTLRLPSAICAVISIFVFYHLMKNIFRKTTINFLSISNGIPFAVLLSIILATQRWFFNFGRFSFEVTFLLMLELIAIYYIIKYVQKGGLKNVVLTGLFTGLAYNSYISGRLFFILPFLAIIYKIIQSYKSGKHAKGNDDKNSYFISKKFLLQRDIIHPIVFFVIFLIVTLPLNHYLMTHNDIRIGQQMYFMNTELSVGTKLQFLSDNISNTFFMFMIPGKGDSSGLHNYPMKPALNPLMNILFFGGLVVGMYYIYKRYRSKEQGYVEKEHAYISYSPLFLLWIIISLIPTLLTYPWENPNMLRTFTILPSVVYFSGISIMGLIHLFKDGKKIVVSGIILVLIFLSAIYELRTYYVFQTSVFEEAFEIKDQLRGIKYSGPLDMK